MQIPANIGLSELLIIVVVALFLVAILGLIGFAIRYILHQIGAGQTADQRLRVPCPYCAELILRDAKVCRFCGRSVT